MKIMVPLGQGKLKDQRGRGEQTNRYHAETREPVILLHNNVEPWVKTDKTRPMFQPVNENTFNV